MATTETPDTPLPHLGSVCLTHHALQRYRQRTPPGAVDIETAWDRATPADYIATDASSPGGASFERAWYFAARTGDGRPYDALFLARYGRIITVYSVAGHDGYTTLPDHTREFLETLRTAILTGRDIEADPQ